MSELVKKIVLVMAVTSLFLSGCATTSQVGEEISWQQVKTQIPSNNSLIYVVRPEKFVGSANLYKIIINNAHVADIPTGKYFSYLVSPGNVLINAETKPNILNFGLGLAFMPKPELSLTTTPGEIYFVNVGVSFSGGPTLTRIEPEEGESLIEKSKKIDTLQKIKNEQ